MASIPSLSNASGARIATCNLVTWKVNGGGIDMFFGNRDLYREPYNQPFGEPAGKTNAEWLHRTSHKHCFEDENGDFFGWHTAMLHQ